VEALPKYQRDPIDQLIQAGQDYSEAAQSWLTASAANTFRFASTPTVGDKRAFLESLRTEVRAFLCGDKKYQTERSGLFGKQGIARTYVISAIAVAVAPHLSVASAVIAPVIALILASIGKITLNAWCATS